MGTSAKSVYVSIARIGSTLSRTYRIEVVEGKDG